MRRKILTTILAAAALSSGGCMLIDMTVDPVGCGTGTHKPIFPWYPSYLFNPELKAYGDSWRGVPAGSMPRPLNLPSGEEASAGAEPWVSYPPQSVTPPATTACPANKSTCSCGAH